MVEYVWHAISGIDNNGEKANNILKKERFTTFEDIKKEFKELFGDEFLAE